MDFIEICTILVIGILQAYFSSSIVDYSLGHASYCFIDRTQARQEEIESCEEKANESAIKKFAFLQILAIASYIVAKHGNANTTVLYGVGFGSTITMLLGITSYWYRMNEITRMATVGSSLAVVLYSASKFNI